MSPAMQKKNCQKIIFIKDFLIYAKKTKPEV